MWALLPDEAREILQAVGEEDGLVLHYEKTVPRMIMTTRKSLIPENANHQTARRFLAGLEALQDHGYLTDWGWRDGVFKLTEAGKRVLAERGSENGKTGYGEQRV